MPQDYVNPGEGGPGPQDYVNPEGGEPRPQDYVNPGGEGLGHRIMLILRGEGHACTCTHMRTYGQT